MKIISLWQPYASLLAYKVKRHETRSWSTKYRGPILIHASKRQCVQWRKSDSAAVEEVSNILRELQQPLGTVVAIANLIDCVPMTHETIAAQSGVEKLVGDWSVGRYAWHFSEVRAIVPIPCKGRQGLMNAEEEIVKKIGAVKMNYPCWLSKQQMKEAQALLDIGFCYCGNEEDFSGGYYVGSYGKWKFYGYPGDVAIDAVCEGALYSFCLESCYEFKDRFQVKLRQAKNAIKAQKTENCFVQLSLF